jgi:glycosyltransferase involved in cell wall biosynthesis
MGELFAALKAAYPHWEIEVLTGPRVYRGDGGILPRKESWNGIAIRRLHTFRRRGADPLWRRALSDLAFSLQVAWHVARSRCDAVLAVTNPPIMPIVAAVAALLTRLRTVYLIHDLYPDVPVALGLWHPASLPAAVLRRAQGFAMRRASRIVVLGETMRAYLAQQYGVDPTRVAVIPNWATISTAVGDRGIENHAEEFVVMYAGNLGRLHDFETVLDAAGLLQNEPAVRFVIAGDGARAAWLHREVERRRLSHVVLRSFLPDGEFETLLRTASLGIVTLEPGMEPLGVPSKTYNLLAAGVPLLAITGDESEVARLIRVHRVGYRVTHGDARGFASIVSRLQRDREHWRVLSANARAGAAEARVEVAAGRYAREIVGAAAPATG